MNSFLLGHGNEVRIDRPLQVAYTVARGDANLREGDVEDRTV